MIIESDRLFIRRIEDRDFETLIPLFCDPEMMRYLGGVWTAEQSREALQEWRAYWGNDQRWYGSLVQKEAAAVIGTAGLTLDTLTDEPGYELSWFILPAYQGKGYATEISKALIQCAFLTFKAERIVAETDPDNPASNQVLKKLEFANLGLRHHQIEDLPGFDTQRVWALSRENWNPDHQDA